MLSQLWRVVTGRGRDTHAHTFDWLPGVPEVLPGGGSSTWKSYVFGVACRGRLSGRWIAAGCSSARPLLGAGCTCACVLRRSFHWPMLCCTVLGFVPQWGIVWQVDTMWASSLPLWASSAVHMFHVVWCGVAIAGVKTQAGRAARECFSQRGVLSVRLRCVQPCASFVLFVSCIGAMMLLAAVGLVYVAAVTVGYSLRSGSCAPQLCMRDACVGVVGAFEIVHGLCRVCKLAIARSSSCAAACARVWLGV